MNRKKQRGEILRTNLLFRAEHAVAKMAATKLLIRCVTIWREPTWRARKLIQKGLNVMSFRTAVAHARRRLLSLVYGAWADVPCMEAAALKHSLDALRASMQPPHTSSMPTDVCVAKTNPASLTAPPGLSLWQ